MNEEISMDSIEAFMLKECCETAIRFEKTDIAKDVLRKKSKKLDIPANYVPAQPAPSYPETEMQILSDVIYGLSQEGYSASGSSGSGLTHRISALPESGEKEFVSAVLALRNGADETHRIDAMRHLSVALSYAPDDPRYIALAEILQNA